MRRFAYNLLMTSLMLILIGGLLLAGMTTATAAEPTLITSVNDLVSALANANDGDTVLVGNITFKPMPMGMIVVPKNVTIKSGLGTNAVFTNATFALNGSTADSSPLTVRFENIDFRGDNTGVPLNPASPPSISSQMPGIMKTMCAAIFKMNVDATYVGCTFEGYHYGYGGIFSAIYSSADNINALNLTLNGCTFRNNAAKYGGSIYLSGYGHNISLDARHCAFEDNAATTGGAIWAEDANVHLLDCSLVGNQYLSAEVNEPNGGALALYNCGVDLDGCLIANNTSGGDGAGVFCEISPFKTLIMENCTVIGNSAPEDEGISVALARTNFDTSAAAHIYFSSLFGEQNFADNVELFGCLIVDKNVEESEPCEENNYCLELTPESAEEQGLIPETPEHVTLPEEYTIPEEAIADVADGEFADSADELRVGDNHGKDTIADTGDESEHITRPEETADTSTDGKAADSSKEQPTDDTSADTSSTPQHISLPTGKYPIPKEAIDKIAGGKFADSLGKLQVGDNYAKAATVTVNEKPGHKKTVTLQYGDELPLEEPERDGYTFESWEYPEDTSIEEGKVFIGGVLPDAEITAKWRFALSENLYVIWVPIAVLVAVGVFLFYRKKKATTDTPAVASGVGTEASALPSDWVDRVCMRPEMVALMSGREMDVLHKVLEGKTRRQIAEELFITESTVKKHTTSIYAKLHVSGKVELISKFAQQ